MPKPDRRKFMGGALGLSSAAALLGVQTPTSGAPQANREGSITDVPGVRAGHFTDSRRPTGCTALLFDSEATAGVDYDGSAPGEHLGVALQPVSPLDVIHGLLLTGGGPMGLDAVSGAVRYLEEHGIGYDWGIRNVRIPLVVGGVIDDLALGDGRIRPDAAAGYKACQSAASGPLEEGNIGIGNGATVGKMLQGRGYGGMKSGLGTASLKLGAAVIGALVVPNSNGDIVDWQSGKIIAGARRADGKGFANIVETLKRLAIEARDVGHLATDAVLRSTTLAVVATNIGFSKVELSKIAMMASTGAARCINPYHTNGDGDSTFALSTNRLKSDLGVSVVGALAADLVSRCVLRAVRAARSVPGWPALSDWPAAA